MKHLLLVVLFLSIQAQASVQVFNSSDLFLGNVAKVKCVNGVACSNVSGKLNLGVGIAPQVASTTTTITSSQCGSTFVSDSADVMTLPEASTVLGCKLRFVCGTADDFDVNPNDATDKIGIAGSVTGTNTTTTIAPSAGDAIRCTDIGAGFDLEAVAADLWAVTRTTGIITDVN
jgi:hypothetical protein